MEKAYLKVINQATLRQPNPENDDGQIVMLIDPECPTCDLMKKAFENAIETGFIQPLSTETEEGAALMEQLELTFVPVFLILVDEKLFSSAQVVAAAPNE